MICYLNITDQRIGYTLSGKCSQPVYSEKETHILMVTFKSIELPQLTSESFILSQIIIITIEFL